MKKFKVIYESSIEIEFDETKFNEAFMKEFRESFYPFYTWEDHAAHLAYQHLVNGALLSPHYQDEFIEGYGEIGEFGIKVNNHETETYSIEMIDD